METALQQQRPVRVADLVASLSLATDMATGQVMGHGLRRALLAVWLGEELGLAGEELRDVYYVALLGTVGCALEAAVFSEYVHDEIAVGERLAAVDPTRPLKLAAFFLREAGAGYGPFERARKIAAVALTDPRESARVCRDVSMNVGEMLDLGGAIRTAIGQCHEQWSGKGPRGLEGEAIAMPTRLHQMARDADIFSRLGGVDAAIDVARSRSGKQYDPQIADCFAKNASRLLGRLDSEPTWDAVLAAEPTPVRRAAPDEFDRIAAAISDFVDARSVYTLGHSRAVAALAEGAARALNLAESEVVAVRQAGLLHDIGRAGVPVSAWDKRDKLTRDEWERMKKHPALTELVFARSDSLGHLGTLASLHHERLDGSGYRGMTAPFLPVAARILAVADAYQSKIEPRPHRAALRPDAASMHIEREAEQGRLDADVVRAVLTAAGQPLEDEPRPRPAGLTDREVEVLQLAARGLSNRAMAKTLVLSPKTVGRHIEHIYEKVGVSTRVGATLFALRHGLVEESGATTPAGARD